MKKESFYFRNKALTRRHRLLGPLARWLEQKGPTRIFAYGCFAFGGISLVRGLVVTFYSFFVWSPFVILAISAALATLSWALRRGKTNV